MKLLFLLLALCGALSSPGESEFFSYRAKDRSEKDWRSAKPLVLRDRNVTPNTLRVRSLWDADSLYFRFEVDDRNLWATVKERDGLSLFRDDMCEVLLDPRVDAGEKWLEDDLIYHINILGYMKDDRGTPEGLSDKTWNGKETFRSRYVGTLNNSSDKDGGYVIDLSIPWSEIGKTPGLGLVMGVNFGMQDRYGPDSPKAMVFWKFAEVTRTPSSFGRLILRP